MDESKSDVRRDIGGKRKFRCLYTNARSIRNKNKLDELELRMREEEIDIVGITETWVHNGISDAELSIEDFVLFRKDRGIEGKCRGGGVMVYIRKVMDATLVYEDESKGSESIWIRIKGERANYLIVGVCYRSPTSSDAEDRCLMDCINLVSSKLVLIMGDFNYPDIDWNVLQADSGRSKIFLDMVNDSFLTQHVREATRDINILDLVLTSEPEMVDEVKIGVPLVDSDHNVLSWEVEYETVLKVDCRQGFKFHKGDYEKVNTELMECGWDDWFQGCGVDEMWCKLVGVVQGCMEKYVPKVEVGKHKDIKDKEWMNVGIRKVVRSRNRKWLSYRKNMTFLSERIYKASRNKVTGMIRKAKYEYEDKIANNIMNDPKSFYAYVRRRSKTKVKVGPLETEGGSMVEGYGEMAELFNKYFASVFTVEDVDVIPEPSCNARRNLDVCLSNVVFDDEVVKRVIGKLQDNKAPGVDGINSTLLKKASEGLVKPLVKLFVASFDSGEVPKDWKDALVSVVFKKGSRKDPGNYRPVSLTCQIGKVMERIIKDVLMGFLEGNNLIYGSQHGFRSKRSCLTNLLEFMERVADSNDKGEPLDIIFLDLQKAFDKVPHLRLLRKLEALGVGGRLLDWIREWLRDRRQRVVLGGFYSEWEQVRSGVPQGSVLGPVLFTIFINDLDEGIVNKLLKFADDTKVLGKVVSEEDVVELKKDLQKIMSWSEMWQMKFNTSKCKVMHMGFGNRNEKYEMGGTELVEVTEEKDLGVVVSCDGKVAKQCAAVAKKGYQVLGLISRTFVCKKAVVMVKLYKSLVRPHLDYCVQAWRPYLKKDIDVLERVQRRATRMVEECKGMMYEHRLRFLKLTTLETRRLRADLIEVFKIVMGLEGLVERDFFVRRFQALLEDGGEIGEMRTRGNNIRLYKKRFRLDMAKYSFGNRVIEWWNKLPSSVVEVDSVNAFKGRLDRVLRHTWGLI